MRAEALLAHYARITEAPDAIARLRRFVLDLAMRGKLVPQDPKEEHASELLKRIGLEKSGLPGTPVRGRRVEGRSRTTDFEFALPSGWAVSTLGEVALKIADGAHQTPTYVGSGVPFVSVKDFSGGKLNLSNTRFITESEHRELYRRCDPRRGDLLIGRIGTLGRAVVVDTDIEFSLFVSVGLIRLSLANVVPHFLRFLLNSPLVEAEFDRIKIGGGTHTNKLNLGDLKTVAIPLPPLAEQHRIVAKVDELMALCDRLEAARTAREATRDRLAAASLARLNTPDPDTLLADARFALDALPALTKRPDQIKQLRQTILNLAVRGKLVPQEVGDEPAAKLLRRLRAAQSDALATEGIRARQPVQALQREELWFDVPPAWELTHFDEVFVIVSGVTKGQRVPANEAVEAPYLRVANVQRGFLDLAVMKTLTVRAADVERYALRADDLLMTEGGDWDKLGRTAVWRDEVAGCIHQNHVFRVRPPSKDIASEWVAIYANSPLGRTFFEDASKQTTNLASINMTQLRGCPLPLPPLAEQHRIVAKVDALMAFCDQLEASLATASTTRAKLLEASLRDALLPAEEALLEAAQ
ncbi:restriction endonuclease subunit S [Muricoccus vinaceus]|uniref:Restriction endonuclease subunit S n=1 Tax=Muricoccus vinaceus TaxID=424704 RepID=A0ABV6J194_9PROT